MAAEPKINQRNTKKIQKLSKELGSRNLPDIFKLSLETGKTHLSAIFIDNARIPQDKKPVIVISLFFFPLHLN